MQQLGAGLMLSTAASGIVVAEEANPIQKTLDLLTAMQAKIAKDGEVESQAYSEYSTYCSTAAQQRHYELKTGTREQTKFEAVIADKASTMEHLVEEVNRLQNDVASNSQKLGDAKAIRKKENEEFQASEAELMKVVEMLNKAIEIIEKQAGGEASLIQTKANLETLQQVLQGLASVAQAASFLGEADQRQLAAFVQQTQNPEDIPTKAYDSHSGGIEQLMEHLRDKSEVQLRKERVEETNAQHNFDLLETSLKDAIRDGTSQSRQMKGESEESKKDKASAEGKLASTNKMLADSAKALDLLQRDCQQKAADHEVTGHGRLEELNVLSKAKKLIQGTTAEAEDETYSFLQAGARMSHSRGHSSVRSKLLLLGGEVVNMVSKVATEQQDKNLAKLASQIKAVFRFAVGDGGDPFKKVKGLIKDMIGRLEQEALEEAEEKAYCDKNLGVTKIKKAGLEDQTEGLVAEIDNMAAQSAMLKDQVRSLSEGLSRLAQLQVALDKAREDGKAAFVATVADLDRALTGVRGAIKLLKDYYANDSGSSGDAASAASFLQLRMRASGDDGDIEIDDGDDDDDSAVGTSSMLQQPAAPVKHKASSGAGSGIIGLLEVIEDDLAKNNAEEQTEESDAAESYDRETQTNKVTKSVKRQAIKQKTKQIKALATALSNQGRDLEGVKEELTAVDEFFAKLKERCIAKPETYEETKRRREKEIRGLEEAISILKSEKSLLQRPRQ